MKKTVCVYTDGSSRGNPGPGGYGSILKYTDASDVEHVKELSCGYELTTNNRMEIMGVIAALELLKTPCKVKLTTDSQYVANAISRGWLLSWKQKGWKGSNKKPVKNIDLWMRMDELLSLHDVDVVWVKGHAGHPENERCDFLATSAADSENLLVDEGYENDADAPAIDGLF